MQGEEDGFYSSTSLEKKKKPSTLMALINEAATPPKKRRISSVEDADLAVDLVYTSILDFKKKVVPPEVYGYGAMPKISDYKKLQKLGQGTYGTVYKAIAPTGEEVAIKKMKISGSKLEKHGMPESVLREITCLKALHHDNIVNLITTAAPRAYDGVFMVMEYCEADLAWQLDKMEQPFIIAQIKCLMLQLLNALIYIHDNLYLHRDIKTSNILLNKHGVLKLADFGLARTFNEDIEMTPRVVTLWYRAIELLLGSKTQNYGVDIWPVGCILAELILHKPLFMFDKELQVIQAIIDTFGIPTEEHWPGFNSLPYFETFTLHGNHENKLAITLKDASVDTLDFLQGCFVLCPWKRLTALEARDHYWFETEPLPCRPSMIPVIGRLDTSHHSRSKRRHSPD